MPHYGLLREFKFEDTDDVRGAEVYGVNNEKLGTIDDVIFDHSSGEIRYVVVDTGGWLKNGKFLVPVNRIQPYGNHPDKFYAELDKERIQMLPEFNDDMLKSETGWTDYEKNYENRWHKGTVMYNEATGRIVTPPMDEVASSRKEPVSEEERRRSLQRDFTPQRMGREDQLWGVASSGDPTTLHPTRPSIAGKEDAEKMAREKKAEPPEGARVPDAEGLQEPGVYRLDAVPEAEKKSDLNEPLNANYGRRWVDFQKKLREGRDKVVGECPLCGTQKKVA